MPSHMAVQTYATDRNQQAEILVDFILQRLIARLHADGYISTLASPIRGMRFQRDDCSDIFDHYVELDLVRPMGGISGPLQLWGQTTCYKGNTQGKGEPNKTYEVRETLVEALGLRRWLLAEGTPFRTIHFTIGPVDYTYKWFRVAKDNAFDLSLYPSPTAASAELFAELTALFAGAAFEYEFYSRLEGASEKKGSRISEAVQVTCDRLYKWFTDGLPVSVVADRQAKLLSQLREQRQDSVRRAMDGSRSGGAGIKRRAEALLAGGETDDTALLQTLRRLNLGNPFLEVALEASADWAAWCRSHLAVPAGCKSITEYIHHLWTAAPNTRSVSRRLLLRIHTDSAIQYIQDTGIQGLTEHNLYGGEHSPAQVWAVVDRITVACSDAGIRSPGDLYGRLSGSRGRQLLRSALRFETRNGTSIRPSFLYVEEVLSPEYVLTSFGAARLPGPIAYHAAFGEAPVDRYQNMKLVYIPSHSAAARATISVARLAGVPTTP